MAGTRRVTAFAPASVGNVAVGFDLLGHALEDVGDRVSVELGARGQGIRIVRIRRDGQRVDLPLEPEHNTATRGLLRFQRDHRLPALNVEIEKGIPLGSGMGSSAASAVAAVMAANELLEHPMPRESLLDYALEGERVASAAVHADNVAPSLFGGLVLCPIWDLPRITRIPVPEGLCCVLVHPHLSVHTREARALLSAQVPLARMVEQAGRLGGVIAGCYAGDTALIAAHLRDVVVEPQRAHLVPGFAEVQAAAREAGAIGGSLSGSGPSLFEWTPRECAAAVREAMVEAFGALDTLCEAWISRIDAPAARVEHRQ